MPLCHESTPLAPPLELATSLVHAKFGASLVGVYFSNATPSDTALSTYAIRLAERISAVTSSPAILVQVMNERLMSDCEQDRLVAYEKDGETWKECKWENRVLTNYQLVFSEHCSKDPTSWEVCKPLSRRSYTVSSLTLRIISIIRIPTSITRTWATNSSKWLNSDLSLKDYLTYSCFINTLVIPYLILSSDFGLNKWLTTAKLELRISIALTSSYWLPIIPRTDKQITTLDGSNTLSTFSKIYENVVKGSFIWE